MSVNKETEVIGGVCGSVLYSVRTDCALDDNSSWSNVTGIHTLLQNYFRLHNDNLHIQTFIKEGVSALTQEDRTIEQLAI